LEKETVRSFASNRLRARSPKRRGLSLSIGKTGIRALAHGLFESFKEKGIQRRHRYGRSHCKRRLEGCRSGRRAFLATSQSGEGLVDSGS
jgi:hypothetical protein